MKKLRQSIHNCKLNFKNYNKSVAFYLKKDKY